MEAELSKELREAADQLLDIVAPIQASAFPPSPHLQQRRQQATPKNIANAVSPLRAATFSANSKIEVLHSPSDLRPWQWPAAPSSAASNQLRTHGSPSTTAAQPSHEPIQIELGSNFVDDPDDHLPSRGLSSRVRSVKAAATHQHDHVAPQVLSTHLTEYSDPQYKPPSPSKLRVRTPINDIYINQYGERVVQGKVVGRTLGGRPKPVSHDRDTLHTTNDSIIDRSLSFPTQSTSPLPASERLAGTANTSSPPPFFLESFPDAFQPKASTSTARSPSPEKNSERRSSKGGPPTILKAPCAVAGALTLAQFDDVEDASLLPDASFRTASDFDSPTPKLFKQLSLSPRPRKARLSSETSTRPEGEDLTAGLSGLQLHNTDRASSPVDHKDSAFLTPSGGVASMDSARSKLGLPSFRRPTPTIELSQAKAEPVVLHGNRRQAIASGAVQSQDETSSSGASGYASPAVSPPTSSKALPNVQSGVQHIGSTSEYAPSSMLPRLESASEPSSPLLPPHRSRVIHGNCAREDDQADANDYVDHVDNASLESAPSSLVSLPVSNLTSSSRSLSHHSLERRRSGGSTFSYRRRQSPSSMRRSTSDVFAREIRIRGWSEVGSQARGWVVFELRIITKQGTPIIAHKRFSSFVKLRTTLLDECKDQAKWLPQLPTRRTGLLSKYDAKYLEKRRRALQRWLEVVALDRVWGASEALRDWVLASE